MSLEDGGFRQVKQRGMWRRREGSADPGGQALRKIFAGAA